MEKTHSYHTLPDLIGQRFGRYAIVKFAGYSTGKSRPRPMWKCLCDCGTVKDVRQIALTSGVTVSCGCKRREGREVVHGESDSPEYRAYHGAKERCNVSSSKDYPRWGGKGIRFLFTSFEQFLSVMGRRPTEQHSLDRWPDKKGDYEPSNCRWATSKQQGRNKNNNVILTVNGEARCISEWAEVMGHGRGLIKTRRKNGWCDECAVLQPIRGTCIHR
jgi:hypothetical protein